MAKLLKPIIFGYHDYRKYIQDMMGFLKIKDKGFSAKALAHKLDITSSYLSMILNGKRDLSTNLVHEVSKVFQLAVQEESFLELLVNFSTSKGDLTRSKFFERMKKFKRYRELNPKETQLHNYMSNWLNVVIREMTALKGFSESPRWIQSQLQFPAALEDVKKSVNFLITTGIITKDSEGNFDKPDTQISCMDKVYKNALITFHREFLQLAGDSTKYIDSEQRRLLGHCVALSNENIHKAKKIIEDTYKKLRELQEITDSTDKVYFMELALFPLTNGDIDEKS